MMKRLTIMLGSALAIAIAGFVAAQVLFGAATYNGPSSADGKIVRIVVSDRGMTPGADFYCDVKVLQPGGRLLASWNDPQGQGSRSGVTRFLESMHWKDGTTLLVDASTSDPFEVAVKTK